MIELSVRNGRPLRAVLNEDGELESLSSGGFCWSGYAPDMTVTDELAGRIFRRDTAACERIDDASWRLTWVEADFVALECWRNEDDCLVWEVKIELLPGKAARSIAISQLISYPYPVRRLKAWAANERFPNDLEYFGGQRLIYGDVCYGTLIPAVAIYTPESNVGLTIAKRFGTKIGKLAFHFRDYHGEGVDVEHFHCHLAPEHPVNAEILLHAHEGCFRPALAFLTAKFPDFFTAPNPALAETPGGFCITTPFMEDGSLDSLLPYDLAWVEIHNHFPRYGDYAPEEKGFESVIKHDFPEVKLDRPVTRDLIYRHIQYLHRKNIQGLLYLQCAGDVLIPYGEEQFADSLARDSGGNLFQSWFECCFANAMEGTTFHRHMMQQIDRFFAFYPDIDGVFLDQLCYQCLDYAHSDGVTAVKNRPVAQFGYSYEVTLKKVADYLHRHGKTLWANGPFNIEIQKEVDGIMIEGTASIALGLQYLTTGSKGLLVYSYFETLANVEQMFRYCLICGGNYSLGGSHMEDRPMALPDGADRIFGKCIPLVKLLTGCQWVLSADPVTRPEEYEGNIFHVEAGAALAVTLASKHDTLLRPRPEADTPFPVLIRVPDGDDFISAQLFSTENAVPQSLDIVREKGEIRLIATSHRVFSVIILRKKS